MRCSRITPVCYLLHSTLETLVLLHGFRSLTVSAHRTPEEQANHKHLPLIGASNIEEYLIGLDRHQFQDSILIHMPAIRLGS